MAEKSDDEIIALVLSGDADSFEVLIERYKDRVFKIISAHVPAESVEETASDVFFKAYKSLNNFKRDSPFLHWLSVIAVNTCRDFWRAGYSCKEYSMSSFGEDMEKVIENRPSGKTPEDELLENERKKTLYKAMEALKPNERIIINMLYKEERSVSEAAELSCMTESNVKVVAFRARKKLAAVLNKMMGGAL